MIARVWHGRALIANADAYARHFHTEVLPELERLDGFGGASLLRREGDDGIVEFMAITRFDSLEAVRAFAGSDYERAVVASTARDLLLDFDERVKYYVETGGSD